MSRQLASMLAALAAAAAVGGQTIAVLHPEGQQRSALVLRSLGGVRLADGELEQHADGGTVTTRVVFRFGDGSLHDETVVFSQEGALRLIRDRLVQRGPAFPRRIDMGIDGLTGRVTVRHAAAEGAEAVEEARFELPATLANGMVPTMLKNIRPGERGVDLWLVVATPRPRLVRLAVHADTVAFRTAAGEAPARRFVLHPEIGGLSGFIAPLVGKKPPDSHVLILQGDTPAYVQSDQPLYVGGPLWRIDVLAGKAQR